MKNNKLVLYRRKREGRTNYKKRLTLLKGRKPRLVIRKTNNQVIAQIVDYSPEGDKILVATASSALKKLGWNYSCKNMPACYLAGFLLGKKAKDKKVNEAIVDFGLQSNIAGSKLYAVVQGAKDAGLEIPVGEGVLPTKERIIGAHISSYYSKGAGDAQFSKYRKENVDPAKLAQDIENLKKKMVGK